MDPRAVRDRTGELFLVRSFQPEDRPALDEFYEHFHPPRVAQGLPPQGAERVVRWLDGILPEGCHLLVFDPAGGLAGHAFLMGLSDGRTAEYAIFLHQSIRGRGIGTQVNRLALEAAREAGFRRVWLSVAPGNRPAILSYQKVGFRFLPHTVYSSEAEMTVEL